MTRKENIYKVLEDLCNGLTKEKLENGYAGFDATTIGKKAGIDRSNTSRELNSLVAEKKVVKIKGRPVRFLTRSRTEEILGRVLSDREYEIDSFSALFKINADYSIPSPFTIDKPPALEDLTDMGEDVFDGIIGSKGSLELAIKQAKAAILYPPRGLHTMLTGPTGVGKTTFAETMYKYAKQMGRIGSDARFVIFNCSEYAENPQLILSQLFGYVRGAFTGADREKPGLVEKANRGILLLDEIHRLPPEGQEMLFLLMDKNVYRRLGETDNQRKANVLIIGATTEDINSTMLKTFLRRIPMVIKLPPISERPLTERFELIKMFFRDEMKSVKVPIKVYRDVIKALLLYDCQGNVGQLKADIQLLCARGFLDYKTGEKTEIYIEPSLLPDYIYDGLLNQQQKREELLNLLHFGDRTYYEFISATGDSVTSRDESGISSFIYKEIGEKYEMYMEKGFSQEHISRLIKDDIKHYLERLLKKCNAEKNMPGKQELFKIVSPRVYNAVELALRSAEKKLNKTFDKKVVIGLAMHVSALMERMAERHTFYHTELDKIAINNPDEFNAARLIRSILEQELGVDIPKEEIGFIAMLLSASNAPNQDKSKKIGVVVLSHGRNTATSIADVVNTLLCTEHCKAVDMPLDMKVDEALEKTIEVVKQADEGKGVLLLVDMGSLIAFSEIITKRTGINTRSVEMVSTPLVLEAVRKSFFPEMTLDILAEEIKTTSPYLGRIITDNIKGRAEVAGSKTIITTCVTGEGTAVKISQLLKNTLPEIADYNIALKPMNINKYQEYNYNPDNKEYIIAVVGTIDLQIPNVPFIGVDELITGDGFKRIERIIYGIDGGVTSRKHAEPNIIIKMLRDSLMFLDPEKAYNLANDSFKYIAEKNKLENVRRLHICYIFHTCFMMERVIKNDAMPYKNVEKLLEEKPDLYKVIKSALSPIEDTFEIKIPDTEIGYVMDIFDTQ